MNKRDKDKSDKNYWKMKTEKQIRDEYNRYLIEEKKEPSSDQAHLFAIKKTGADTRKYFGFSEREIVEMLGGEIDLWY